MTCAAAIVWTAGWLAFEAVLLSGALRDDRSVGVVLMLAAWTGIGAFALVAIAWAAAGKPEVAIVSARGLELRRGIEPFARTQRFDGGALRALRVLEARPTVVADYDAVQAFWDRGVGRVAFDIKGLTYAFGPSLDDAAADTVRLAIADRMPEAFVEPIETDPDEPRSRRRRPGWGTYVMRAAIVGGLAIPLRTFVTDLPICTGGAMGGEYDPVDPASLRANGRVVLVPFGDFPSESAESIAAHFRTKFELQIEVGPRIPLPGDAIDPDRSQADSNVLLSALAAAYPETPTRTIAIGLTGADLFIPDASSRYAFSDRRPPRFAVASPVRMDRGCMGIRPASPETQLARLRRMVGKDIGLLFYQLPLSDHPRSMMYRSIGGPQELDTIRDEF
jgi:hypothetical protein